MFLIVFTQVLLSIFAVSLGGVGGWATVFLTTWIFRISGSRAKLWSAARVLSFGVVALCPFLVCMIMMRVPPDGTIFSAALGLGYAYAMGPTFIVFLWLTGRFLRQEVGMFGQLTDKINDSARLSGYIGAGFMVLSVMVRLVQFYG